LLAILLFHEFGHYIAAKIHKVPASLPHFIPFPWSPFGTMGAIIGMKGRIASRKALLDIGAAGPLAGLLVTIPVLFIGLRLSPVLPVSGQGLQEGQSLLYWLLKRIAVGPIPEGHDVFLHPIAFAGWGGLFLTMINLLPVGQLDGGHVAYALFGKRQHRIARFFHNALPLLFLYNLINQFYPLWKTGQLNSGENITIAIGNSLFWLFWFGILHIMGRIGGRDHPETDPGELGLTRTILASVTLMFFVLLFMPTPMSSYSIETKDPPWQANSDSAATSSPTTQKSTPESTVQPSASSTQPLGSTPPNPPKPALSQAPSNSAQ
jgi:membrane-associated protease RseP (regulator of RpoE activity)